MRKIHIITYFRSEAEQLIQAFTLLESSSPTPMELFCPAELIPGLPAKGNGICIKPLESYCSSESGQLFFSGLASYQSFCSANKARPLTLYLHRELAIMELSGNFRIPKSFRQNGLNPCLLKDDPAGLHLWGNPQTTLFHSLHDYFRNKQPNDVLFTVNSALVEALIMQDSDSWQLFHPDLHAINLGLDVIGKPAIISIIPRALAQLKSSGLNPMDCFNLLALRSYLQNEEGAYSFFAEHYDDYMSHVDYDLWVSKILGWSNQYGAKPLKKVLELACGTANISTRLIYRGFQVDACDLSVEMLTLASSKALKPNLYQASLTDPIPGRGYQMAVCMFDSVNYLLKNNQIGKMLKEVALALEDNGLFIFDISTQGNSLENFADLCNMQKTHDGFLVHQAWYEVLQQKQRSSLHYFRRQGLGYSLLHEQHTQRVYLCHELVELISKSPLKLIAIHNAQQKTNLYPRLLQGIDEKYHRLFFVLRKEVT